MGKTYLFFHISGFVFTDSTYVGSSLVYQICNPEKNAIKDFEITYQEAQHVSKSYHLTTDDLPSGKLIIKLVRKSIFDDELIGTVTIPFILLPMDVVTLNTLPLIMDDPDVGQVGIRIDLHLTETQEPYRGAIKDPVLMQMDLSQYSQD